MPALRAFAENVFGVHTRVFNTLFECDGRRRIFKFPDRLIGRRASLRFILSTHVAAPGSINSKRITAKPAREGFVIMCACTEPVRTGIGAVCVEYGRPKGPITMLNHTYNQTNTQTYLVQNNVCFFHFWLSMLVRPVMKRLFFPLKTKKN